MSGQEVVGGLAPWVLAALRFDELPVIKELADACHEERSRVCVCVWGGGMGLAGRI